MFIVTEIDNCNVDVEKGRWVRDKVRSYANIKRKRYCPLDVFHSGKLTSDMMNVETTNFIDQSIGASCVN